MRASVDQDLCTGCAICVEICPEFYVMQGDKATTQSEIVPPDFSEKVTEASESCPTNAISLEG